MKYRIDNYKGNIVESVKMLEKRVPNEKVISAKEVNNGKSLEIETTSVNEVSQKYPTVPTKEYLLVKVDPSHTSFSVYGGASRRRIYGGGTNGDKIVSNYFDGNFAVIVCQKRTFVFGPGNQEKPLQNWRMINNFPSH